MLRRVRAFFDRSTVAAVRIGESPPPRTHLFESPPADASRRRRHDANARRLRKENGDRDRRRRVTARREICHRQTRRRLKKNVGDVCFETATRQARVSKRHRGRDTIHACMNTSESRNYDAYRHHHRRVSALSATLATLVRPTDAVVARMSATETKTRVAPGSRPLPTEEACPRGGSPSWWSRRPTRPRVVARLGDAPRRPGSIPEKKARATARRSRRFARAAPRRPRRARRRARRRRRRDATRPSRGRHPRPGTRTRADQARIKALKALKASSSVDRRLRTSSSSRRLFLFLFLFFRRSGSGFFFFPRRRRRKRRTSSPPPPFGKSSPTAGRAIRTRGTRSRRGRTDSALERETRRGTRDRKQTTRAAFVFSPFPSRRRDAASRARGSNDRFPPRSTRFGPARSVASTDRLPRTPSARTA